MAEEEDIDSMSESDQGSGLAGGGTIGTVKLGRRKYAIGLNWQTAGQATKSKIMDEARDSALRSDPVGDFVCALPGETPMYGVGYKSIGHTSRLPVLACHLVSSSNQNWIGAFRIDGGFYFFAVLDGNLIPGVSDVVYESEHIAKERLWEILRSSQQWHEVFAPPDWGFEVAEPDEIEKILSDSPKVYLSSVSKTGSYVKLSATLIFFLVIIFGGWQYYMSIIEEQEAEQLREMIRAAELASQKPPEKEVVIPPMPWETEPVGVDFIKACLQEMRKTSFAIPGVDLVQMFCERGRVNLDLGRRNASLNWIAPYVNRSDLRPSISLSTDGSSRVSWPIPEVRPLPKDVPLYPIFEVNRYLVSHFDEWGQSVRLGNIESVEFYSSLSFSFQTRYHPESFIPFLSKIVGMTISRVVFNFNSGLWTIEGAYYERRPYNPNQQRPIGAR
jgi:hypothetical protein